MGCGCKGDNTKGFVNEKETGELNWKGTLLRIPAALALTLIYVILSPFVLIYIWWLAIQYTFNNKAVLFAFLKPFQKKRYVRDDDSDDEFNEDEYELMDVEVIK